MTARVRGELGCPGEPRLQRRRRAVAPPPVDDGDDVVRDDRANGSVGAVADDEHDRSDAAGDGGVEGAAEQAASVDLGVELVVRTDEAAALAGGEDDGDGGGRHHSRSLAHQARRATPVTARSRVG